MSQNKRGAIGDDATNSPTTSPKRNHLFVIGIDNYVHLAEKYRLSNAKCDAEAIKRVLTETYRFDSVTTLYDAEASHAAIMAQLRVFEESLNPMDDNLVIYFAGHGYRYRGKEFTLLSADFREETVKNMKIPKEGIKQADLFAQLEDIKVHQLLLILEDEKAPCRIGLTAGKDDEVVSDGIVNRNSPFAAALIDIFKNNPNATLRTDEIKTLLKEELKDEQQKPCCEPLNLDGHEVGAEFVFFKKETEDPEKALWATILAQNTEGGYLKFLRQFPRGEFAEEAEKRLEELEEKTAWEETQERNTASAYIKFIRKYPLSIFVEEADKHLDEIENQDFAQKEKDRKERERLAEAQRKAEEAARLAEEKRKKEADIQRQKDAEAARQKRLAEETEQKRQAEIALLMPEMVLVKGGTFKMGSDKYDSEKPIHAVTLNDFHMGKYPITQAQWQKIMGNNPSHFKGDNMPVEMVNWYDCQAFCKKISEKTGETFRLPTEAEWEYAARGGNQSKGFEYSGSNNVGEVAWYNSNSDSKTHTVGTKKSNELGIYDMSGNVWEWCSDWYGSYSGAATNNPTGAVEGSNRVLRGGGWYNNSRGCRVANRYNDTPTYRNFNLGFRVAISFQ
jgi:formylglycine-generating enzyme required for sulfatase activity